MHAINIECDDHTQKLLMRYLEKHKLTYAVGCKTRDITNIEISSAEDTKQFKQPVRIGAILDYLNKCTKKGQSTAFIAFDGAVLNTHLGIFTPEGGTGISLTEKEVEILIFLSRHTHQSVSRDALLDEVWGYAKDVETHTLETHVYRLRQKIEANPAEPKFLQTTEDGYSVHVLK